jgi:hypothetical protein
MKRNQAREGYSHTIKHRKEHVRTSKKSSKRHLQTVKQRNRDKIGHQKKPSKKKHSLPIKYEGTN